MKTKIVITSIIAVGIMLACKKTSMEDSEILSNSPVLPATPYSYPGIFSSVIGANKNIPALGRVLFYDKNLSLNNTVSCASCHQQSKAFCDNLQFSTGLEDKQTPRNSPSIFAKSGRMFWDGRAGGVNGLVLGPIKNHIEMKFDDLNKLSEKLSKIPYYSDLFKSAYGSSDIDSTKIQNALSAFINAFVFSNNKFSNSKKGGANLNPSELEGKKIFFGKAKCGLCHHLEGSTNTNGYGFTDLEFNIGLEIVYKDKGIGAVSNNPDDNGKFMVPTLLNVEYTAPYMHDGRFKTLEEVVEHYNSGVKNHPNLSPELRGNENISVNPILPKGDVFMDFPQTFKPNNPRKNNILPVNFGGPSISNDFSDIAPQQLNLTLSEKKNLVDFLKTLTDPSILTDKRYSNPFKRQ